MKTVEDFKKLIDRYYQRDDETKEQYEVFKRQYSYANLQKTFDSLPEIEKKFKIKLPQDYKSIIETDSIWYMDGETEQFGIYDERQIYEFNYIGRHKGKSSIEDMKDFYLFGQDYGELSYFFDPFNKLGYGIDAVWRVNRCSCDKRSFEFVAKNFYELKQKRQWTDSNFMRIIKITQMKGRNSYENCLCKLLCRGSAGGIRTG